jgi:gliding motility-associated-like protein
MKKILFCLLGLVFFGLGSEAQTIDNTLTPAQCVQQVFLGQGITVTNVQFQGDSTRQIAKFSGFASFGIDSGIVLSTGDAADIAAPSSTFSSSTIQNQQNTPQDQDIADIIQTNNPGISANDPAILEFDFVPQGDTIQFEYVFGSEEYPEFVCEYNDGFGMFLSGPGINGPFLNNAENIALITNTNIPVSIYNINGGDSNSSCAWENSNDSLYVDNASNTELVFDGITTVLRARAIVQCGQTYHLKIAIADAGDFGFDSGVLLKAKSLSSNLVVLEAATGNGDTTLVEGCMPGIFRFIRPSTTNTDTLNVPIEILGTAINGVDYNLIPDTIVFLPGVDTVTININPFSDAIAEGPESIIINIQQLSCSGTVFNVISSTLWIVPPSPIVVNTSDTTICLGESVTLIPAISGGYTPYNFLWNTGATTPTITVSPGDTTDYYLVVTDTCTNGIDTGFIRVNIVNPPNVTVSISPSEVYELCGAATVTFTLSSPQPAAFPANVVIGGTAFSPFDYTPALPTIITFPAGITSISFPITTVDDGFPEGLETVIVSVNNDNACQNSLSADTLFIDDNYIFPQVIITPQNTPVCPGDTVFLSTFVTGGSGNFDFLWNNAAGPAQGSSNYYIAGTTTGNIYVTVTDSVCGTSVYTDIDSIARTVVTTNPIVITANNPPNAICPGDNITLSAFAVGGNGTLTYTWTPGNLTGSTVNVNPAQTTTYTVTVNGACNSSNTATVTAGVNPLQPVVINPIANIDVICPNTPITITPVVNQNGNSTFLYYWSPGNFSNLSVTLSPVQTTTYTFAARGICNQTDTARFTINVPNYSPLAVEAGDPVTVVCKGNGVEINATTTGGGPAIRYSFGGAGFQPLPNYTHYVLKDTVILVEAKDTCGLLARDSISMNIPNYATLEATVTPDTAACFGNKSLLSVTINGGAVGLGYDIIWSTGQGADSVLVSTLDTNSVVINESKRYRVRVKDICSTFDTASIFIRVKACDVDAPNVFTPNGDNVNNRFIIKGLKEYPNALVSIYDRWGRMVFESSNYTEETAWDGSGVDAGTYFYIVQFTQSGVEPMTGTVQLLR